RADSAGREELLQDRASPSSSGPSEISRWAGRVQSSSPRLPQVPASNAVSVCTTSRSSTSSPSARGVGRSYADGWGHVLHDPSSSDSGVRSAQSDHGARIVHREPPYREEPVQEAQRRISEG